MKVVDEQVLISTHVENDTLTLSWISEARVVRIKKKKTLT